MSETVTLDVTTVEETVSVTTTDGGVVQIAVMAERGEAGTNGTNGGSTSAWNYNAKTNATSGYPGNGYLLWNNATQTSATSIIVSHLADDDTDIELLLSFFVVNQKIFIQDRDDSSKNQVWLISGTPTVTGANTSTAYYTFPVTLVSSAGGAFTNNHSILFGQIVVATNAVTSATTTNFTTGQVLYANGSNVGSLSRSGIDTRTNFPNDDVTAATNLATASTLVRRGTNGNALFSSSVDDIVTLDVESNGDLSSAYPSALRAQGYGAGGIGAIIYSDSSWGAVITSNNGTGALITSNFGTYHADFGSGDNRSAIERVRGWFVWFYNSFTGRLKTADITANRDWTFPDASGNVVLDSNTVTLTNKTLTSPAINSATIGTAATFNATSYTYGTGAATEHMASIVGGSGIRNVFCYDDFMGTSASGGTIGEIGWAGTGTSAIRGNELNHPGIYRLSSATTGNLSLTYLSGAGNPDSFNGLTIEGVFRIGAITNCRHTFGVGYVGQYMTNGYRGITFDPANSANWRLHHRTSAGADTFTDTGKAAVANDWVRVKLTYASGLTTCTIATTSSTTDATVTNTGAYTVGTAAHTPQWVFQSTSGTQTLDFDAFMMHGKTTRL